MYVAVIIGITAMICLTVSSVLIAVMSRRSVSDAFRALERDARLHQEQLAGLLDRFQAIRWEDLAALRSIEDTGDGGFIPPEEQGEGTTEVQDTKWGHLSKVSERMRLSDEEEALLSEDFDEEGNARRATP